MRARHSSTRPRLFRAGGECGGELDERLHAGSTSWLIGPGHGVEIAAVDDLSTACLHPRAARCALAGSDVPCVAHPLPDVAGQVGHTAGRGRDRPGRGRRLDRARCGRGREAHQGAGSARREAAGDHADLLSRRRPRGSPPRTASRRWARAPAARSSSCCCSTRDGCGSAPAPTIPTARWRSTASPSPSRCATSRSLPVLGIRRGGAALGPPDAARARGRRTASARSTRRARVTAMMDPRDADRALRPPSPAAGARCPTAR